MRERVDRGELLRAVAEVGDGGQRPVSLVTEGRLVPFLAWLLGRPRAEVVLAAAGRLRRGRGR